MPLHRRSPKWGFTNIGRLIFNKVNLDTLSESFKDGDSVTPEVLTEKGLIRGRGR
ncbi:MAG: 50S ribosomal protein L15, partial [Bacteroidia bacterium]|nr:50S ribosomal protein L15 [Bacteroidia bacterium]